MVFNSRISSNYSKRSHCKSTASFPRDFFKARRPYSEMWTMHNNTEEDGLHTMSRLANQRKEAMKENLEDEDLGCLRRNVLSCPMSAMAARFIHYCGQLSSRPDTSGVRFLHMENSQVPYIIPIQIAKYSFKHDAVQYCS